MDVKPRKQAKSKLIAYQISLRSKRFHGVFCAINRPDFRSFGRTRPRAKCVFAPQFARVQKYGNQLFGAENSTETLASQANTIRVSKW